MVYNCHLNRKQYGNLARTPRHNGLLFLKDAMASIRVSCGGVATRPRLCPIAQETASAATDSLCRAWSQWMEWHLKSTSKCYHMWQLAHYPVPKHGPLCVAEPCMWSARITVRGQIPFFRQSSPDSVAQRRVPYIGAIRSIKLIAWDFQNNNNLNILPKFLM